jgi:hypothetical protein
LDGQVTQIGRIGGIERASIYRDRIEQLRDASAALYSHVHADVVGLSRLAYEKMKADQASLQDEFKLKVEEEARRVADMKSSDESYRSDIQMAEIRSQTAELGISSTKASIAQLQALLAENEAVFEKEQKALAYLRARREELQQELAARTASLENMELRFATELSLSDEVLRRKAAAEVEKARQEAIEETKLYIRSLARQY